jgi:hypothetical protein
MGIPFVGSGLVMPELVLEIGQRSGIVERMDIAGDQAGNRPHLGTGNRTDRQQGRLRINLVEIFEDGRRLDQRRGADVEGRHALVRIDGLVALLALLPFQQIDRHGFVRHALQVERDPDPVGRG